MIRHLFLDKTNTIIKGSDVNIGLNPIMSLSYGNAISRGILHFDLTEIQQMIADKDIPVQSAATYTLKMTNCVSVNGMFNEMQMFQNNFTDVERAASFSLMLFKLPKPFDQGKGYETTKNPKSLRTYSTKGSSWYISSGTTKWDESGIYSVYKNDEGQIVCTLPEGSIVSIQHFDYGNENLEMDITNAVNEMLNGEHDNNGFGLAFVPDLEITNQTITQYVGFFTDETNTVFNPYIEVNTGESIMDNRANCCLGKENKLYLYCNINGEPQNLDAIPTCTINEKAYQVKQARKGVYYALISPSNENMEANTIYYDKWSNLALNGEQIEDVELEFNVLPSKNFIHIGDTSVFDNRVVPSISGLRFEEKLDRDEVREIVVDFRKEYTTDQKELIESAEYRIYIKDGEKEVDVIDYSPIEKAFLNNFFVLHMKDFVPQKYFIDIAVKNGREKRYYKNVGCFVIESKKSGF